MRASAYRPGYQAVTESGSSPKMPEVTLKQVLADPKLNQALRKSSAKLNAFFLANKVELLQTAFSVPRDDLSRPAYAVLISMNSVGKYIMAKSDEFAEIAEELVQFRDKKEMAISILASYVDDLLKSVPETSADLYKIIYSMLSCIDLTAVESCLATFIKTTTVPKELCHSLFRLLNERLTEMEEKDESTRVNTFNTLILMYEQKQYRPFYDEISISDVIRESHSTERPFILAAYWRFLNVLVPIIEAEHKVLTSQCIESIDSIGDRVHEYISLQIDFLTAICDYRPDVLDDFDLSPTFCKLRKVFESFPNHSNLLQSVSRFLIECARIQAFMRPVVSDFLLRVLPLANDNQNITQRAFARHFVDEIQKIALTDSSFEAVLTKISDSGHTDLFNPVNQTSLPPSPPASLFDNGLIDIFCLSIT